MWLLLLMLGAVTLLVRQLRQPATTDALDRMFGATTAAGDGGAATAPVAAAVAPPRTPAHGGVWDAVKDNATFLPDEQEAWFSLWREVQGCAAGDVRKLAAEPVTYAQLVNQPQAYRGLAVAVRGRVLRETLKPAPANSLGISAYHQLVLAPTGGGDWPIIVYALELPAGFPRGDGIAADVAVTGWFFKNWSYQHAEGMGLAPVLVAGVIDWRPAAATPAVHAPPFDMKLLAGGVSAALVVAVVISVLAFRLRPRVAAEAPPPDFSGWEA